MTRMDGITVYVVVDAEVDAADVLWGEVYAVEAFTERRRAELLASQIGGTVSECKLSVGDGRVL